MSNVGIGNTHIDNHFNSQGLCQCSCGECTMRLLVTCICIDCPCEDNDEHNRYVGIYDVIKDRDIEKILQELVETGEIQCDIVGGVRRYYGTSRELIIDASFTDAVDREDI